MGGAAEEFCGGGEVVEVGEVDLGGREVVFGFCEVCFAGVSLALEI